MSWDKAAMKEDRQQLYFDAILFLVSDAGGKLSRKSLIAQVKKEIKGQGNVAWHVDRMVANMIRERSLVRQGNLLSLNTTPGAQLTR